MRKLAALAALAALVGCGPPGHYICTGHVETQTHVVLMPMSTGKVTVLMPMATTETYCVGGKWVFIPDPTPSPSPTP